MTVRALTLDVRVGESVNIDRGRITVTVEEKSGQRARLKFTADESVGIKKAIAPARGDVAQARAGINFTT